jgi:hypothetical protein
MVHELRIVGPHEPFGPEVLRVGVVAVDGHQAGHPLRMPGRAPDVEVAAA